MGREHVVWPWTHFIVLVVRKSTGTETLSSGVDKREAVAGKFVGKEHHVAGVGVWTLWVKPLLAKSQANRREGRKEMYGGISWICQRRIT